jgi:DNA-binding MarR family transcriptional regulator
MSAPSSLESHLGYRLRIVSNYVSQRFARAVEGEGATVAEWVVLRELYEEDPAMPSRLADRLGLTRGAVSKLADRLIAKTLVEKRSADGDARSHRLALTARGRGLVPRLAALADRNDAACFGALDPTDRDALERILGRLVERHGLVHPPLA